MPGLDTLVPLRTKVSAVSECAPSLVNRSGGIVSEKNNSDFLIAPNKILKLGLNAYEVAAFFALQSHAGKNAQGIFPSWERIGELGGMSRAQVWRSLKTLELCNVIRWERGKTGRSNTYCILGCGAWIKKGVGITRAPVSNRDGYPSPIETVEVSNRDSPPSPIETLTRSIVNQDQLTRGTPANFESDSEGEKETPMSFGALIAMIEKKTKGVDAEQVKKIIDRDWSACESDRNP